MDRTLILVKPDAFARGLTGEIIARFERKGLRIVALRHMTVTRELAERHYAEHAERPFFGELVDFITSGPIVAMVLEGARRGQGRAPGDRRDQPARGRARLDPRRLRDRDGRQHGPRLGLAGVGRARGRAVLRGPVAELAEPPPARPRLRLAAAPGDPLERLGVPFTVRVARRRASSSTARTPRRWRSRTRCARRAPRCARGAREAVLGCDTVVALDGVIYGKPPDEAHARAHAAAPSAGAPTR